MANASGISVFDVHHHVGDASGALGLPPEEAPDPEAYAVLELSKRIEIMDAGGIDQAAVIPGHGYLRPNGHANTQAVNDKIAAYRDATPDRFPVAIGIVEPRDGEVSLAELERAAGPLGLVGMSFHTRFQGREHRQPLGDSTYVGAMGELGLLPVIHALDETAEESLWKVGQLASRHPHLTMLVLDGYSTHEGTKHCGHLAATYPNLVFDCSLSYNFDFIANHVRQHGAHRYVYGTDLYSWPLGQRISHILGQLLESDLSDDEKASVAGGNARRLLGLEPS